MFHPNTYENLINQHHNDLINEGRTSRLARQGKKNYDENKSLLKRIVARIGGLLLVPADQSTDQGTISA